MAEWAHRACGPPASRIDYNKSRRQCRGRWPASWRGAKQSDLSGTVCGGESATQKKSEVGVSDPSFMNVMNPRSPLDVDQCGKPQYAPHIRHSGV